MHSRAPDIHSLGISVGYLDGGGLPVVRIVLGVLCAAWLITEIVKLRFARIFFPLAFILLLFEGELASMLHVPARTYIPHGRSFSAPHC